jgi:hypothetical protein
MYCSVYITDREVLAAAAAASVYFVVACSVWQIKQCLREVSCCTYSIRTGSIHVLLCGNVLSQVSM